MDKYLQIIASASLFRGIAKTEIAAVLQNLDAQLRGSIPGTALSGSWASR